MFRRVLIVALLVILAGNADTKRKNYGPILRNPEFKEVLAWLAPEKMLLDYNMVVLNSSCQHDLSVLNDALNRRETWALTMLDASSKPSSGLLQGNLVDWGHYDECSAIRNKSTDNGIRGRYCTYSISVSHEGLPLPANPTLSICLPASCSASDILAFYKKSTASRIDNLQDLKIQIVSAKCSTIDPLVWDLQFILCLVILVVFLCFLIACTAIEMDHSRLNEDKSRYPVMNTLAMFSLRKSAASILSMEVKKGSIPEIDGMRTISMAIIVLLHQYSFWIKSPVVNSLDFFEAKFSWDYLYVYISYFFVDTFFTVTGFLMTYLFLKQMRKQNKFDVPSYYLHRYLRLTPAVAAFMVFSIVFIPKFGSGPYWDSQLNNYIGSCQTKWWVTLAYLQNFVYKENNCLGHLWYSAVDMQLFWISPLILYPLYKNPKFGLILVAALLLSLLIFSASVIGIGNLHTASLHQDLDATIQTQVNKGVYIMPYHRAGPWLVGILVGYEVATHDRKLSRWNAATGWLVTIASFAFCTFGTRSFLHPDYEYNAVWETFFSVVSRPIWALGICWIIYASIKSQAGFVSNILSHKIFLPLSRLSYHVYLIHPILIIAHDAALKTPRYFSHYYLWRSFLVTLMISTAGAFLLNLLFESPILVLEKILKGESEPRLQKISPMQSKPVVDKKSEPSPLLKEFTKIEHSTIANAVTNNVKNLD